MPYRRPVHFKGGGMAYLDMYSKKKKEGFDEYCESENQEWFFGFSC